MLDYQVCVKRDLRDRTAILSLIALVSLTFPKVYCYQTSYQTSHQATRGRVDVFSQKGGRGLTVPSPPYVLLDEVILYANVTYREYPQQNSAVVFEIVNPQGELFVFTARTNASGIATTIFLLPSHTSADEILGVWQVLATARVEKVLMDVLEFCVKWNYADADGDFKVDIKDVAIIALAFGSQPGDLNWNPKADLTGLILAPDGRVDEKDIELAVKNYGKTYP